MNHHEFGCRLTLQNQQLKKMRIKIGELDRLLASLRITQKDDIMPLKDVNGQYISLKNKPNARIHWR